MTQGQASTPDLEAHFRLPHAGEKAVVIRPAGAYFPISAYVQWRTPGTGRDVLNSFLEGVTVLELDHVADAVVAGDPLYLGPLREFGQRHGWTVSTTESTCRLQRDGDEATDVSRIDVLLALELITRAALAPFDGDTDPPSWVLRSREAHPRLVSALHGVELFVADDPAA